MIQWWWLIPTFVGGGLVSYYFAQKIYEGGEALYNKVIGAANADEKRVVSAIKARLP